MIFILCKILGNVSKSIATDGRSFVGGWASESSWWAGGSDWRRVLWGADVLAALIVGMTLCVCIYVTLFKYLWFVVYQLYLNKVANIEKIYLWIICVMIKTK